MSRFERSTTGLLEVAAIDADGLLISEDGVYVRYLQVSVVNPLILDAAESERVSSAFAQIAARLPDGQSLQLYVQGTPLDLQEILAQETHQCEQAAGSAQDSGERALAQAIRRFGIAQEQSIRDSARTINPLSLRYVVVCPWKPTGLPVLGSGRRTLRVRAEVHKRAARDSLRHLEGVRADLEAMDLSTEVLAGGDVLDLLHERFDPDARERGMPPASFLSSEVIEPLQPGESTRRARARGSALARTVCTAEFDLSDRRHLRIGDSLERTLYVSLPPEQTWLGWLLHLMQTPRPFCVSVHIAATERYRERMAQKRRYKRLYGVNRGVEQRGRPLDPDARLAEEEAAELIDELASTAGAGIYHLSIYAATREPAPDADPEALGELCQTAARELTMASDAGTQHGPFAQARLWRSTLPLGRDVALRRRKYLSRNVGDSFPLVGTGCSSPEGIPVGFAVPGRTLVRLDPFDPANGNHLMLVNGMGGAGKTMAVIILLIRALARGATGFIIDLTDHFGFLAALVPGAVLAQIGGDAHAINSWDVDDPKSVGAEKVDFLLALHALLLGEHHADRDSYGLSDLESNILGLAISEVYARCALTGEEPRERLLQEELERRYEHERDAGATTRVAETLRDLSIRLSNYVGDGPYTYLTDRATTIPREGPLIVFDTQSIPDAKAAAVMFVICEHVKSRIARTRREYLAGDAPNHGWSGRTFLVIDEAWKQIERPATGRWFNEFVRRGRHLALWIIAISQQLSDFDNEWGKALLENARVRLFLRQEAKQLAYIRDTVKLGSEAIETISCLRTYKGLFSMAYLMNGVYGESQLQIGVGPLDYWIATSNATHDAHIRAHALRETDQEAWRAMERLINTEWQQLAETELEPSS